MNAACSQPATPNVYYLYGLRLRSEWPLPYTNPETAWLAQVDLRAPLALHPSNTHEPVSNQPDEAPFVQADLPGGPLYLRWLDLFEFVVSADGRAIDGRPLSEGRMEVFHSYLLGQALSFALIRQGLEPLHATAVVIEGHAVAFLGDSGYGKSSLGAAFLQAGYPLLTDDLLVVRHTADGVVGYPGPPRIKLYPDIAKALVAQWRSGTPISQRSEKLVIPLDASQRSHGPTPLRAVYVLNPQRSDSRLVTMRAVSKRRACVELIRGTFNRAVTDSARLARQLTMATEVAKRVPVKRLSFPRELDRLSDVRDRILSDVSSRTWCPAASAGPATRTAAPVGKTTGKGR